MHLLNGFMRRGLLFLAISLLSTVGLGSVAPAQASTFGVSISVNSIGAATGTVSGIGGPYTTVLTATGAATCSLTNGPAVLVDYDTATGNPAVTNTSGFVCHPYDGTTDYTLTYTGGVGVSGTFYRSCVWVLGNPTCTPGTLTV